MYEDRKDLPPGIEEWLKMRETLHPRPTILTAWNAVAAYAVFCCAVVTSGTIEAYADIQEKEAAAKAAKPIIVVPAPQ